MPQTLAFTKGHGTGNDFVVIADPDGDLDLTDAQIAALCDRRFGIGADGTLRVANELAETMPNVRVLHLDRKGRGLALRTAWGYSDADVVVYMDVDLSTGLDALLPLVAPLVNGHSDLAVGSRLAPGSRTVRGTKREMISRAYNKVIHGTHGARFSDAQCGFKAARTDVVRPLLHQVYDDAWFFDTELLLLAEHNGLRVHEVPVDWVEDVDARVNVTKTATDDLAGLLRVARAKVTGAATVPVRLVERMGGELG